MLSCYYSGGIKWNSWCFLFCKAHNTFYDVRAPCYVFPYFLALWNASEGGIRRLPKFVPSGENVCCRITHNRMTKKTELAKSRIRNFTRDVSAGPEKNQEISIQLKSFVIHWIIESCQPDKLMLQSLKEKLLSRWKFPLWSLSFNFHPLLLPEVWI